jgi:hypothetical protein
MFCCPIKPLPSADCSRKPGLKSSLNEVHLKIRHALKETSYPTDKRTMAGLIGTATTIGSFLLTRWMPYTKRLLHLHQAIRP